jgi:hypothetical protein
MKLRAKRCSGAVGAGVHHRNDQKPPALGPDTFLEHFRQGVDTRNLVPMDAGLHQRRRAGSRPFEDVNVDGRMQLMDAFRPLLHGRMVADSRCRASISGLVGQ